MDPPPYLIAALLALVILAVAVMRRGASRRARRVTGWAGMGGLAVAAGLWLLGPGPPPPPRPQAVVTNRPVEMPVDGYVSSHACRACHPRESDTWSGSYHRTMTQVAAPGAVLAPFDGVELAVYGQRYDLERRGDEFWVEMNAANGERVERPIVLTTGSHHFQAYWFATGHSRKLGLFPFCYEIADRRWIPMDALPLVHPSVRQSTPDGDGRWNSDCSHCHSVDPRPRISGPDSMDSEVAEFGIACEACHGPGEKHIRLAGDPLRRYRLHLSEASDDAIVNPARLDQRRSVQVCGQCHSVHSSANRREERRRLHGGGSFRPGEDLEKTRRIVNTAHASEEEGITRFWPDGFVRVNGREYNSLLESDCYEHSDLTCLSCHRLHQAADDERTREEWADDQLKPGMRRGSAACVQCHGGFGDDEKVAAHTHHGPGSSGSDCYNCHMPNTAYGLHKATRNHQIDSPRLLAGASTGRPNACNLCHLDQTLEWTAEHLEAWYGLPRPELSAAEKSVAAGVLMSLRGDAVQRALAAWHMGWEPAARASGTDWMPPFLATLLTDPYAAVRFIAHRSLTRIPGFEDSEYEPTAEPAEWRRARRRAFLTWTRMPPDSERADPRAVLLTGGKKLRAEEFNRLLAERDDRFIYLAE